MSSDMKFKNKYGNIEITIDSDIVSRIINEYGQYLKYGYSELEFHKEITGTYSLVLVFESSDEIKDIFEKYAHIYVINRFPKNFEKTVLLNKENVTYHLNSFYLSCLDHFKDSTVMKFECGHVYAVRNL